MCVHARPSECLIPGIQCLHSKWAQQEILGGLQSGPGILRSEQLRSHYHGDGEVGSQLKARVSLCGVDAVLVDPRPVYIVCLEAFLLTGNVAIAGYPKVLFKVFLDKTGPLGIGHAPDI